MPIAWRELPVTRALARRPFDCGNDDLNRYLSRFAVTNHRTRAALTYLALARERDDELLGYYTVCPTQIEYRDLPAEFTERLGKYPVGGYRLARLAVDLKRQGEGLGAQLLFAAGIRCWRASTEAGGTVLLIDAKNQDIANWYMRFGAAKLLDDPHRLVISLRQFARLL